MVFFNWATMQMAAKIVYYGPGLCGKTSNLSYIYAKTTPNSRGEMVSLETESDRTLFFDLLPIEVGTIGGFKTRLQLYTVPGQVFYNTTRKLVLKGVDGLVFVADSQRPMRDANIESFQSLVENLKEFGLTVSELPIVLQFNKRDLPDVVPVEEMERTKHEWDSDANPSQSDRRKRNALLKKYKTQLKVLLICLHLWIVNQGQMTRDNIKKAMATDIVDLINDTVSVRKNSSYYLRLKELSNESSVTGH